MDTTTNERPATYDCTLCGKVHRLAQQSRGAGTDKYSMHYSYRVGGPSDLTKRTK